MVEMSVLKGREPGEEKKVVSKPDSPLAFTTHCRYIIPASTSMGYKVHILTRSETLSPARLTFLIFHPSVIRSSPQFKLQTPDEYPFT